MTTQFTGEDQIADAYRAALKDFGLPVGGLVLGITDAGAYVETSVFMRGSTSDPEHYRRRVRSGCSGLVFDQDCRVTPIKDGAFIQAWTWIPRNLLDDSSESPAPLMDAPAGLRQEAI